MNIDPPTATPVYAGNQVQLIHGRMEGGTWVIYVANSARLFRVVPSAGTVSVIATPGTGYFFYGSAFAPVLASLSEASPSASRTMSISLSSSLTASPSQTATLSLGATPTPSNSPTSSQTTSPTSSVTASLSVGAAPSESPVPTVTQTAWVGRFVPQNLLVLRGGTPGGSLTAVAQPLALVEYTPTGGVVSTINVPTMSWGPNFRCSLSYATSGYQSEGLMQRSADGTAVVFGCSDMTVGAAVPLNITGRVIAVLRADGVLDTSTRVTSAFRDSTSATLFRTVATVDGTQFWMTGSTSSTASFGLHYVPSLGATQSIIVNVFQAANQRYTSFGPSGNAYDQFSSPQLYMSLRDVVRVCVSNCRDWWALDEVEHAGLEVRRT